MHALRVTFRSSSHVSEGSMAGGLTLPGAVNSLVVACVETGAFASLLSTVTYLFASGRECRGGQGRVRLSSINTASM
eukprot:2262389-Pleurochrysis_carterae.AAC.1